ncbi:MAG: flagellar biosynthesis anti-sigma factor FlgM [Bdellovibrionota bacterium]
MKIDNKNNPAAAQINGARGRDVSDVKNKSKNSPAAAELTGESSKVNMSDRAQMMAKAKAIATKADAADDAKIARIQAMVDAGTYKVDSAAVADKLVDEHLLMVD